MEVWKAELNLGPFSLRLALSRGFMRVMGFVAGAAATALFLFWLTKPRSPEERVERLIRECERRLEEIERLQRGLEGKN